MSGKTQQERLMESMHQEDEDVTGIPGASATYHSGKPSISVPPRRPVQPQHDPNAIKKLDDGSFQYKRYTLTPVGLDLPDDLSQDEWTELGSVLSNLDRAVSWAIGDWAAFANKHWNLSFEQISDYFDLEVSTVYTYASVCRNVPTLTRVKTLSLKHHRVIAKLHPQEQRRWLKLAEKSNWSSRELSDELKKALSDGKKSVSTRDPLNATSYRKHSSLLARVATNFGRGGKIKQDEVDETLVALEEARQFLDLLEHTIRNSK